jgi:hypothetical protein
MPRLPQERLGLVLEVLDGDVGERRETPPAKTRTLLSSPA